MHLRHLLSQSALTRNEASLLAAHALGVARTWVLAHDTDALSTAQLDAVNAVFARRLGGEPVAYIQGFREFYGLSFIVSPAVLIPRPETELLVDWLIQNTPQGSRVLDLGTGSGAISVALAHNRPDVLVHACDISAEALAIAAQNNAALAGGRVRLLQSNWFDRVDSVGGQLGGQFGGGFDIIVSNPPYIAAGDAHLAQGDLRFEPAGALTDHADGLSHYRRIVAGCAAHLAPAAWLVLEHGYDQADTLNALLVAAGFTHISQHYDAAAEGKRGMARMLVAQKP